MKLLVFSYQFILGEIEICEVLKLLVFSYQLVLGEKEGGRYVYREIDRKRPIDREGE